MSRHRVGLRNMSAFVVMLALTGCGASSTVDRKPPGLSERQAAEHALGLWSRFRGGASGQVSVINGSVRAPVGGFGTGDAKLAFLQGRFILRAPLPRTPLRFRGWRVNSAEQALGVWRSQSSGGPASTGGRLVITGVRLASAAFSTETGSRALPAWAFRVRGLGKPVYVLALPASRVFNAPTPWDGENAAVSSNGRVIRVAFVGGHAGNKPCDDSYTAGSVEDSHAVAFWLVDHPIGGGSQICSSVGYPRIVVIHLAEPLGGRALVNSYGAPVPACRTNARPSPGAMETCRPGSK